MASNLFDLEASKPGQKPPLLPSPPATARNRRRIPWTNRRRPGVGPAMRTSEPTPHALRVLCDTHGRSNRRDLRDQHGPSPPLRLSPARIARERFDAKKIWSGGYISND
jgi:hypothetical protein